MPVRKALLIAGVIALLLIGLGAPSASSSNDHYWPQLWGIRKVGADKAWATGTGKGVTIAVVDTGVDMTHPDLKANIVPGHDFVDNDNDPTDEYWHGTHVAGTAAAVANNGIGVAGVAPNAKIMPVRVLGADGSGSDADVNTGIRWAADHGAAVINLSLGDGVVVEDVSGGSMSSSCDYAWSKGAICVVAAGNQNFFRTDYQDTHAVIVTATGPDNNLAPYATKIGLAPWGISAPGGTDGTDANGNSNAIASTVPFTKAKSGYLYAEGTSMATPHVSGALAILRGLGLSPQQAVDRMLSTTTDIGPSGNDLTYGHGLLNVAAAVAGLGHKTTSASGGSSGSAAQAPSPSYRSSRSSGSSAQVPHASTTPGHATSSPGVTTTPDGSSAPGLAIFSPAPTHHGGSSGWALGLAAIALGGGALGVFAFRLRRRAV